MPGQDQQPGYVEQLERKLLRHLPEKWLSDPQIAPAFLAIYHSAGVATTQLSAGPRVYDIGPVRAVTMVDSPTFIDAPETAVKSVGDTSLTFDILPRQGRTWPEGVYTYLLAPIPGASPADIGELAREQRGAEPVDAAAALASVMLGGNFVYRRIFDAYLRLRPFTVIPVASPSATVKTSEYPDVTPASLAELTRVAHLVGKLPERERNRVELSLRWYLNSLASKGVDSFLRAWIALETLAMPDTTNCRAIEEKLERIYGLGRDQVKSRFKIGLVYSQRCAIVHAGKVTETPGRLVTFLWAVYCDLLLDFFGLPVRRFTEAVLSQKNPCFDELK